MDNRSFQEILASRLAEIPAEAPERQKPDVHHVPLFSADFLAMKLDALKVSSGSHNLAYKAAHSAYELARAKVRPMPVETEVLPSTSTPTAVAVENLTVAARLALQTLSIDSAKVSLKDVRRTFYRLAKKLHPDVVSAINTSDSSASAENYLLIQDAYDLLCAELSRY